MWASSVGLTAAVSHAQSVLSLSDLLERVDRSYPKLQAAERQVEIAAAKAKEKRGAFDPVFSADTGYQRYNSSSSRGKALTTEMLETVVEQVSRSGLKLIAGSRLNFGSVKSPGSSTGDLGEYFVGVKMPLLRGLGINEKSIGEQIATASIEQSRDELRLLRLSIRLGASNVYWDWVGAVEKYTVADKLLKVAQFRAQAIEDRFRQGDLPEIDVVEAKTEVQRREAGLVKAQRDIEKARLKLDLFLFERTESIKAPELVYPDSVATDPRDTWQSQAQSARPDLRILDVDRDNVRRELLLAENNRRPTLDLAVTQGFDGGQQGIGLTVKAGVFLSVPLRQNTVDGQIDQAKQKLEKLELDRNLLRRQIETEVDDAISALQRAFERYEATKRELVLAQDLESRERLRFEGGDGTLFLLNQRERATAETATRLIDVTTEFYQAKAALQAAAGSL
jgi:outer membrane protein TolC